MIILKKTTFFALFVLLMSLTQSIFSQRISRDEYISRYKHIAIEHQRYYGIPASITMAQGILESDSGNSILAKGSNNHFGIKCKSYWKGKTFTHTDDAPDECFRAYDSVEDSYEDHANFLDSSPRYDSLFRFEPTDYKSWARGLKGAGYATAPDYTQRIVKLIEDNKLYILDMEAESGVTPPKIEVAIEPESHDEVIRTIGGGVDPNNYRVGLISHKGYNIYNTNRTCYVVAKSGDTVEAIADIFDLSEKRLRKYNDMKSTSKIVEGEIIYIERKQNRWMGNIHTHKMMEGETLRAISQMYAINESSLRRMNRLKRGEQPGVGNNVMINK